MEDLRGRLIRCFYPAVICTRAATLVEYAIMLSLIAAVALGAVMMVGSRVSGVFQSVNCAAFASCSAAGASGSSAGGHGHHGHHGNHGGGNRGGGNHGNHGKP